MRVGVREHANPSHPFDNNHLQCSAINEIFGANFSSTGVSDAAKTPVKRSDVNIKFLPHNLENGLYKPIYKVVFKVISVPL